jgi:putative Mg2+ transporter-C (MgtC) family protein
MLITTDDLIKLLAALLIGGMIGFEREIHAKAAGLRTLTLITVGSTLFTMLSFRFGADNPGRVASNIVTGVGFLGAGAILLSEGKIKGLTTASSIWVAAALGMGIGLGAYELVIAATVLVIIVLWLFARLDRLIDILGREVRVYDIVYLPKLGKYEEIEKRIAASKLNIVRKRRLKVGENLLEGEWELRGALARHNKFTDALLGDDEIVEVKY